MMSRDLVTVDEPPQKPLAVEDNRRKKKVAGKSFVSGGRDRRWVSIDRFIDLYVDRFLQSFPDYELLIYI
ncbi:hypothetical protein Hanom_Chr12g01115151 [Helianthus anomalus]